MVVEFGLAILGKAAASKAADVSVNVVIEKLLKVQEKQLVLLEAIHEDIRVMINGPWQRARTQLEVAVDVSGREQVSALEKATAGLEEAAGLYRDSGREPTVAAQLSIVYETLDKRELSTYWARRSFQAAERYLQLTARTAQQGIRTPPPRGDALKRQLFSITPPSIEWLWWKNDITAESQLSGLRRTIGSQAAFVPLRLRLRPALATGVEIPRDRPGMAAALSLPRLTWLEAKTVTWTLELPEIQRLYDAHRMSRQLPDIVGLGTSLGVGMQKGTLRVDLAEQREAVVEYTNP